MSFEGSPFAPLEHPNGPPVVRHTPTRGIFLVSSALVMRAVPTVALAIAVAAGCRGAGHPSSPELGRRQLSVRPQPRIATLPSAPAWTYWEPIDAPVVAAPLTWPILPIPAGQLTRVAALEERWAAAPQALRDALVTRGFAVVHPANPRTRFGDFYASLRDDRVPWVITIDTLFFLTHLAIDRALADVDSYLLAPLAATSLHHLDVRLAADSLTAGPDLVAPYVVARGLVAVALALAEPTYRAGPGIAPLVEGERARVLAHAGIGVSPCLGVPIDYSAMSPRGMADRDEARAGWFRAVSWLQNAPLALEGSGEPGAIGHVDVATARMHARAALILAHLLEQDVDAEAANAWARIERASELVIGEADDVTPRDLSAAVTRAEIDPRSIDWIASVVLVDRVRHAVARGRVVPAFHLLGPRSTPDGELLQSLVFPTIGPRIVTAPTASAPGRVDSPTTARNGIRALPTCLDIAAWLGSGEARAALHDSRDDAYERYEETLERLMRARPPDLASPGRHRTPYLSMIDAIETWLLPSQGDSIQPAASTSEWLKRKAEVALAAWTELRHDATALTRIPLAEVHLPPRTPGAVTVAAFVEPHPEAIAKLAALVRQTVRALVTEGALRSGSPALRVLDEVDDLLWVALGAAVYETADDPLPPLLEGAVAAFPDRIGALEAALADAGVADVPVAVDVHVDVPSGRVLDEATGRIDESWMVMHEARTHRLWLALGASLPHHEIVLPASQRASDSLWRGRLQTKGEPPPSVMARAYVIAPEAALPAAGVSHGP